MTEEIIPYSTDYSSETPGWDTFFLIAIWSIEIRALVALGVLDDVFTITFSTVVVSLFKTASQFVDASLLICTKYLIAWALYTGTRGDQESGFTVEAVSILHIIAGTIGYFV